MAYFIPVASAGTNPAWKYTTRWGTVIFIVLTLVPYFIRLLGIDKMARKRRTSETKKREFDLDEEGEEEEEEEDSEMYDEGRDGYDNDQDVYRGSQGEHGIGQNEYNTSKEEYDDDQDEYGEEQNEIDEVPTGSRRKDDPVPGETTSKALGMISLVNRKLFRRFHWIFASIAFILAIAHGLQVGRCHILNQLSMVVFGFFMGTGIAIKFKLVPVENMKRAYLLHTHHIIVVLFLGIIAIGHIFFE